MTITQVLSYIKCIYTRALIISFASRGITVCAMPPHMPPSDSDSDDDDDASSAADGVTNLLAKCTELKAKGNDLFKTGELGAACTAYQEAVEKLTSDAAKKALGEFFKATPGAADTATPLLASLYTNQAACHVKASQWDSAVSAANAALKLEPSNVKARFRRGVAESNSGLLDEAKADLVAVIKADPKNREARNVLEVVNTALRSRTSSEREMFSKSFAGGAGLYADEEAKKAQAAKAAAEAKAAEEAALLAEWRAECDQLRQLDGRANAAVDLLSAAAKAGDAEAQANLDRLAPISLKEFGEAKVKAAAKEKKRQEEAAAKAAAAKAAAEAQSRVARSDVTQLAAEDDDDEELLRGLSKGYKLKADGSKTSFFDRSDKIDSQTKALLDAAKAPKRIDAVDVSDDASGGSSGALSGRGVAGGGVTSAWNAAGTFEERDVSAWAIAELRTRLLAITADISDGEAAAPWRVRVSGVEGADGTASIMSNRGKVKRFFELKLDLKWEMVAAQAAEQRPACAGQISFGEICPAPPGHATACTYETTERFLEPPRADATQAVREARGALQRRIDAAMADFRQALANK